MTTISIRPATELDIKDLYRLAAEMGARHEPKYFERCFAEQQAQKRVILIADLSKNLAGCAQLIWLPIYAPFRRLEIPEIQDLNVIPDMRRHGVGGQLVDACEGLVRRAGKADIGISVGLYPRFGAAQRLYVKKGYIPDGAGVCYDDVPVRAGELKPVDDQLTLKLIKNL